MSGSVTASVIIPAYGRPDLLEKAVRSVIAQDMPADSYEVIVVDSSPDDVNEELVRELAEDAACEVRCLRKAPEGPGPSRNLGAAHARGAYFAFMDSDCTASPGWLRGAVDAFEDGVGFVQGKTIPEPGVPHGVFKRSLEIVEENWIYETANMIYRREPFEAEGGFRADPNGDSEQFFIGGEDVDLAWKVKGAGWRSVFSEEALVMHAVLPIPPWRWVVDTRVRAVPLCVAEHPELRQFFFGRYFFDRTQAWLFMALLGAAGAWLHPATLLLALPYVIERTREPSQTLKGPLRLLRVAFYLPRDLATMASLLWGSVTYRALVI